MTSTPPMNPDIKERWINALLSGEYQQGQSFLQNYTDQHCCLGVLCELAVKDGIIPEPIIDPTDEEEGWAYGVDGDRRKDYLPKEVMEWAGLFDDHGVSWTEGSLYNTTNLALQNDDYASFEQIVQIIQEKL